MNDDGACGQQKGEVPFKSPPSNHRPHIKVLYIYDLDRSIDGFISPAVPIDPPVAAKSKIVPHTISH